MHIHVCALYLNKACCFRMNWACFQVRKGQKSPAIGRFKVVCCIIATSHLGISMESWPSYVAAQHFDPVPLHASGRLSPDQGPHWSDENPRPKENMGLMQSDVACEIWTSLEICSEYSEFTRNSHWSLQLQAECTQIATARAKKKINKIGKKIDQ